MTEIDVAHLETIHGGMVPGSGGGGSSDLHLGGVSHLGHPAPAPHCDKLKKGKAQANAPHGTAITTGGALVQFPMATCAAMKRAQPPTLPHFGRSF